MKRTLVIAPVVLAKDHVSSFHAIITFLPLQYSLLGPQRIALSHLVVLVVSLEFSQDLGD